MKSKNKKLNTENSLRAQLVDKTQELQALRNDHNRLYDNWREIQNLLQKDRLGVSSQVDVKSRILSLLEFQLRHEASIMPEREHNRELMRIISWIVSPPLAAADEEKERMRDELKKFRGY